MSGQSIWKVRQQRAVEDANPYMNVKELLVGAAAFARLYAGFSAK